MKIVWGFILLNLVIFFSVFKAPRKKQKQEIYDCAIICGYPANNDGSPSLIMKSRVEAGVELYQQGKIKYLILSGGAVQNEFIEAKVMADYAISLGIDSSKIIMESQSRSTYHNLMYCTKILKEHNFKQCIVVTNSWHLRKADHYARKFKLSYVMVSCKAPETFSLSKILKLHLQTNLLMYYNLFKGYY